MAVAMRAPAGGTLRPARRRRAEPLMRRSEPFLLMVGAAALIALLATLYLTEVNKAAQMTYEINDLQRQASGLERDQGDLQLKVSQLESLQRIQTDAAGMGMVPVNAANVLYLNVPAPVDTVVATRTTP